MGEFLGRRRRRRRRRHLENAEILGNACFSKMGIAEISRNVNLSEIKAPAGAS